MSEQIPVVIPTVWNGYHFRSRLEARWAVFFTSLGIAFEYEPEGFDLPSGRYLPDFLLPHVGMFAEVKPQALTPAEKRLCVELVRATGRPCLYLVGTPDFTAYWASEMFGTDIGDQDYSLDIDQTCRQYYIDERRFYSAPPKLSPDEFTPQYWIAVEDARGARFGVYESEAE